MCQGETQTVVLWRETEALKYRLPVDKEFAISAGSCLEQWTSSTRSSDFFQIIELNTLKTGHFCLFFKCCLLLEADQQLTCHHFVFWKILCIGSFRDLMTDRQVYFLCNTRKYHLKIDPLNAPLILHCLVPCERHGSKKVAAMNIQIAL